MARGHSGVECVALRCITIAGTGDSIGCVSNRFQEGGSQLQSNITVSERS